MTNHRRTAAAPRPVALPHPPAYLREVPSTALFGTGTAVLRALEARGIYVRPSLAQIVAERARRGRAGVITLTDSSEVTTAREVLPTLDNPAQRRREEIRTEARANRARIDAAIGRR